ncbi:MAG: hypothetical protein AAB728_05250 [Patescibacteria group bacterium]
MATLPSSNGKGVKPLPAIDIEGGIALFLEGSGKNKGRKPHERYASFDYCYNHFQSFREQENLPALTSPSHLAESCLHVAFYLASWGMLRGSSFLLEKSAPFYGRLIKGIASFDPRIWEVDVDRYDAETIPLILSCADMVREALREGGKAPSDILVTKVMLGVFGNVPAYDQFFRKALGVGKLCPKSLSHVRAFYDRHRPLIDSYRIRTFDLHTGGKTRRLYPKAKIIDMAGFIAGQNKKESSS